MDSTVSRNQQIELEKVRTFYRQFPIMIVLAPTGAMIFAYLQHEVIDREVWLSWLVCVLLVNGLLGGLMWVIYKKYGDASTNATHLHQLLAIYAVITGAIWGSIGFLFFPAESREHQMLTFVWLWALGAMISASTITLKLIFHIVILLIMLPLAISSALFADNFHLLMSAATIVYTFGLLFIYHVNHNTFIEAICLRFKNLDLIEQLQYKNREAAQANLAKSQFLAAASHDLRQPIHAQGLYIAELDDHVDSKQGRRILAGLESSIDALRKLLDSVLDIAKLDANVVTLHIENIPLSSLFEEARNEFTPQFSDKDIEFKIANTSKYVRTDRTLLIQVLRNLLSNALRYTNRGRVLLGCRCHGQTVSIEVWDTGIGIKTSQHESIFDEFFQAGNPNRDRDMGLGLGLAIVRRICQLLDSKVSMQSTFGNGSVFRVNVPAGLSGSTIENPTPVTEDINGIKVLLIEDEIHVSVAMQGLLKKWGCSVLNASGADEILEKLSLWPHQPDVIIADYRLRNEETGNMVIEKVRAAVMRYIPAIIVTGDTDPARIKEAFSNGDSVLHKPVAPALLRTRIAQACERS